MSLTTVNIVLLVACCATGIKQFTSVDQLRREFWAMENDLLQRMGIAKSTSVPPLITLDDVLTKFKNFDQNWITVLDNQDNTISETKLVQNMYDIFRKILKLPLWHEQLIKFSKVMLDKHLKNHGKNIANYIKIARHEIAKDICSAGQSRRQLVLNFYDDVAVAELKGYAVLLFAKTVLQVSNEGNYTTSLIQSQASFKEQALAAVKFRAQDLGNASGEFRKCDPERHIEGSTYVRLTNVLQAIVVNEVSINPFATCRDKCNVYEDTKLYTCDLGDVCDRQRRCTNRIRQCWNVDANYLTICPSRIPGRRYDYIKYDYGKTLGRSGKCEPFQAKNWMRWFVECSYCICLCDEDGFVSDRYISMRASKSHTNSNRVVTGLRFVKKKRIIHLQVQDGILQPRGTIDKSSLRWVPVDDFSIYDNNVFENQDYYKVTWENRAIDLDDLTVVGDNLLTGVRFKKVGTHLNFEIMFTPFDFKTGRLKPKMSQWVDNLSTEFSARKRTKMSLTKPDIPSRVWGNTAVDSKHNQFVEVTHTDFDFDAAQTTVPYFDAQRVEPHVPTPLSGAGLYHKGRKFSGGFVAPKITTYDYGPHVMNDGDISTKHPL